MNNDYHFQNEDPGSGGMPPVNLGAPRQTGRNFAITSLVLAAGSLVFAFMGCCCINLIPAILAIIFACMSRKRDGKFSGIAIAGLVIGIVSIVLTLILFAIGVYIGMEVANNPDGEVAKAFDNAFYNRYGVTFQEYVENMMKQFGITVE